MVVPRTICPLCKYVTTDPSAEIDGLTELSGPCEILRSPLPSARTVQIWVVKNSSPLLSGKLLSNAIAEPSALMVALLAKYNKLPNFVTCFSPVPSRLMLYTSVAAAANVGPSGADEVNTITPLRPITRCGDGANAPTYTGSRVSPVPSAFTTKNGCVRETAYSTLVPSGERCTGPTHGR